MNSGSGNFELYNGIFSLSGNNLFNSSNRAFRYGDGLFETIKVVDGIPLFLEDHFDRLTHGMRVLHLSFKDGFELLKLKNSIADLIKKNGQTSARIRLEVFRNEGGFYCPDEELASWHMSSEELRSMSYIHTSEGLTLGAFTGEKKPAGVLSNLKTLNCLTYILAAIYARENGFDDVFIQNTDGKFIEAVSSNLCIIKDNALTTPPLSDGCLNGVLRKNIIRLSRQQKVTVHESSIDYTMLLNADEILLTNVIKGVQWVETFNGKHYTDRFAQKMISWLNESVSAAG